ncbi:hypothetical protein [Mesomycoplasma ovipneumoniae]|uniref:hypothetical protein n=1 Tax=Mesomycoplasma ovipneumoniae TaxID=29562 RepID=UPI00311B05E7
MPRTKRRINATIASTIEESQRKTTKSLMKLIIFHLNINCLVVQSLPIEILSLNDLVINKIEVIKGISAKPIEYCLTSSPVCLNTSSFFKFQAKKIRKPNEARNNNANIPLIVVFNLPIGVVESDSIVCSPSTPLILVKITNIT